MKLPEAPPKNVFKSIDDGKIIIELLQNAEINKRLNEIDKGYPYWEKFKQKVKSLPYPSDTLWAFNKFSREKSISRIKISDLNGFEFKYNTTSRILKYLHEFDLHLGGILEGRSIIPAEEKNRYLISSIMEEAIASSQLEGAATTREIAKEMLRTNRKPMNHSEKMILNNYLTMKKAIEEKDKKLTKEFILEVHKTISKGTLKDSVYEGRFRDNNDIKVVDNVTGEVYYTPPDYKSMESLIESFCLFANSNDENNFIHPIIKGIILHFLIGYIHPFVDGNGRAARTIFYWYLLTKGYWLVEYMSISKIIIRAPAKYGRAFLHSEYDENDLTYFIDYNLRSMSSALLNLQQYIHRKVKEKQSLFNLIKHEAINERQAEILRGLIIDNQKSLTIKEIQSKFGVVYQTARTDLIGLESLGYIKEKKFGKKLVFFKVDDFDNKLKKIGEM